MVVKFILHPSLLHAPYCTLKRQFSTSSFIKAILHPVNLLLAERGWVHGDN